MNRIIQCVLVLSLTVILAADAEGITIGARLDDLLLQDM
jgi:hypothetical protein